MKKRKDHLDSSGAGSQGQKSPGKTCPRSKKRISALQSSIPPGAPGKHHFPAWSFTAKCWWQTEGEGRTPAFQSHSVEHRGLPVLVKSFLRSTQKICCPKSTSFPLASSLGRSCVQISFWQLGEKGMPWPRRDCQGGITKVQAESQGNRSPACHLCSRAVFGGSQGPSRSFFISTPFQGAGSRAQVSPLPDGFSQAETSTQSLFNVAKGTIK
ncbi:uncharacterized protein LOC132338084 [Haemorhous mexicanus]|uniref:uncharacterized protein LOC132338084 n=1 Tax=Haemorhous mexicanus TaxID=30427 RepID=UPI0028BDBBBD|nr:uncharacterized protein LOC132338084 [Haemorhous mexicanus]